MFSIVTPSMHNLSIEGVNVNVFTDTTNEYGHFVKRDMAGERSIIETFLSDLPDDGTLWDIGAAYGLYTCVVGMYWSGDIYAFEPNPGRYHRLVENISLNNLNVYTNNFAIGSAEKWVSVPIQVGDPNSSKLKYYSGSKVKARQHTPNTIVGGEISLPTVIKMDIEGGEVKLLKEMDDILDHVRLIYVEVHPDMIGKEEGVVVKYLKSRGFTTDKLNVDNRSNQYHVRGKKS